MVPVLSSSAAGGGTLLSSTHRCSLKFANPNPPLFSKRRPTSNFSTSRRRVGPLTISNAADSPKPSTSKTAPFNDDVPTPISLTGQENVPLEGVIQFEKPDYSSRLAKWRCDLDFGSRVAVLAGGDVAALLLFSAVGRFSHGFPVFDYETFRTADPFIAGWFLSAYFLGGYSEEGRGVNGRWRAVIAATKSWSLGIPLGLVIRTLTIGHAPPTNFILVTMGSTGVLLIGWRALLSTLFPCDNGKKNDVYKRGSPFELFDLLTSLVRRW